MIHPRFAALRAALAASTGLALAAPALAGDEVLYAPAPDWVEPVDLAAVERDPANGVVVQDKQVRIESGRLWEYVDSVYRVSSLQEMTQIGTITAEWLPDKGDLIIHEITILRGDEPIDVLAAGEEMEVLRREQMLEQQILDGSLTATMSVPGLQIGDELRVRWSVTNSDQALGEEVQTQTMLWREPNKYADFGRVLVSWEDGLPVEYRAGPDFDLPPVEREGGYKRLEVMLPLPEAEDYPADAPVRYRQPPILQLGTFDGWTEVSSVMAPFYEVDGALDGLDDLTARVEAIRRRETGELARAVAALKLVQDDIRYLMNGLDGGNYIPQDVATTWERKYGDCKAKTLILLAILDELGVSAEPVLASISRGALVESSLPLPGAFDHVLVRATIEGKRYYLDGTGIGANEQIAGNVPPFLYTLPIRPEGAPLEEIVQDVPRVADVSLEFSLDARHGGDLPMPGTITMKLLGPGAAQMNASAEKLTADNKRELGARIANFAGSDVSTVDLRIEQGADDSEATVIVEALFPSLVSYDGSVGQIEPRLPSGSFRFRPDRSRRSWRDLPASVPPPRASVGTYRIALPETGGTFEIRGERQLDVTVANQRFEREVTLEPGELVISEKQTSLGGEIAPEDIRGERRKALALAREKLRVIVPPDMPRRWRFAGGGDRSELAQIEAMLAEMIAQQPNETDPLLRRANLRFITYDFEGALADMDAALELEATAKLFQDRAFVHAELRDPESAAADLEEAWLLDPTPERAIAYARTLTQLGRTGEARDLLAEVDGDEEVQRLLAYALADVEALEGDGLAGLDRFAELLLDAPNDPSVLNAKCWYMGTWQVEIADAVATCTRAVENSRNTAMALDSRALIFLRNGRVEDALADAEAALDLAPDQTETLLLRGLILRAMGRDEAEKDITAALARSPRIREDYRRWGFDL
jgi:tetratricopeptide (TPR) repeat protein